MLKHTSHVLFRIGLIVAVLAVFATGAAAQGTMSGTVYAVTPDNQLLSFPVNNPGAITGPIPLTGLPSGVSVVGIDIRPATGQLFAQGSDSRLYVISPANGGIGPSGSAYSTPLNGSVFGFDFNPTVDRIRLTSDSRQNLRLNPLNGAIGAVDGTLAFNRNDRNAGATPSIVASAYTNSFAGATTTTLYNIDSALDIIVTQNPPNDGTLNTVGPLGVDAGANTSFDIMSDSLGSENAFAAIDANFYTINLVTGGANLVGTIGNGIPVRAIAVTGSTRAMMGVPMCTDFDGSASPIVSAIFPGDGAFCRILYENGQPVNANAASQVGVQDVLNRGVIQAVDVFKPDTTVTLNAPAQVCLQGMGTFLFLDASQSPRTPQRIDTTVNSGYTCGFIPNTGTVVLVRN